MHHLPFQSIFLKKTYLPLSKVDSYYADNLISSVNEHVGFISRNIHSILFYSIIIVYRLFLFSVVLNIVIHNLGQNAWNKVRNTAKLEKTIKILHVLLCTFSLL